jgi:hypothetical protein
MSAASMLGAGLEGPRDSLPPALGLEGPRDCPGNFPPIKGRQVTGAKCFARLSKFDTEDAYHFRHADRRSSATSEAAN